MTVTRHRTHLNRSARDFGCRLNSTDMAARLQAALDAGPGTVEVPVSDEGVLAIADPVTVPSGVNLKLPNGSSHDAAVTIKALTADACLVFGEQLVGSWGGICEGFCLDGDNVSPRMLRLGRTLERTFNNITVKNCAAGSSAVLIEETQNVKFDQLWIGDCAGDGLAFDRGAAGIRLYGTEITGVGSAAGGGCGGLAPAAIRFMATEQSVGDGGELENVSEYPQNINFWGGIAERDGGNLGSLIHYESGADIHFWGFNPSLSGNTRAASLLKMEVGDSEITTQSTRLSFWGGQFTGNIDNTTMFDLNNGSIVYIYGNPLIQGFLNQYHLRDTLSKIYRVGYVGVPAPSQVTNAVSAGSVGTIAQELVQLDRVTVVGPAALHQTIVNGDANSIFVVEKANGTDQVAVNTNTPALLLPNGTDLKGYSGNYTGQTFEIDAATGTYYFGAAGTSTPSFGFVTGSPEGVVTAPAGSARMSSDGNLYRKGSGSGNTGWIAT